MSKAQSGKEVVSELDATVAFVDQRIRERVRQRDAVDAEIREILGSGEVLADRRVVFEASVAHLVFWSYELNALGLDDVGHRVRRQWIPLAFRETDEEPDLCADIATSYADFWDGLSAEAEAERLALFGDHFVNRCLARRIGPRTVPVLRALSSAAGRYLTKPSGSWWEGFFSMYELAPLIAQQSAPASPHSLRDVAQSVRSDANAEALDLVERELDAAVSAIRAHPPETQRVFEMNQGPLDLVAYLSALTLAPNLGQDGAKVIGSYLSAMGFISAWYARHGQKEKRDAACHAGANLVSSVGLDPERVFKGILILEKEWDGHLAQAGIGTRPGCGAMALLLIVLSSGAAALAV